ncbi:hypothetical protein F0310_01150 [Borrelia sp. A-FGy1]|uniref:hypothetical protein n=1 Tax=Borrelia sp. A-FGy1 TaxID=2608247 RepID=UPI0015F38513|nr:hypothetical protein [Borrelia sp. A-FGy1]QMU99040.1 hypothetical protein F0310_01150 [Borrelia sp. A-FGy1]
MRKFILFLFFSLIFSSLFAENNSVINDKKKELAIFYYEVGQRYIDVGKVKKGEKFQKKALEIYPRLKEEVDFKIAIEEIDSKIDIEGMGTKSIAFEDVKLEDIPGINHDKIEINELTNAPKIEYIAEKARENNKEQAVKFQFNKFVRALFLQNIALISSFIADEVRVFDRFEAKDVFISKLQGASINLDKDELDELSYLSVDDFYDLKSLKIVRDTDVAYNVQVKAKKNNITKNIPFWSGNQTLSFQRKGAKWVLASIK